MYVCGMTVYDYCHLGHARVMVVFDMVSRWLRESGYQVIYARNITDIDDKIIARAQENAESITSLTARFIDAMHQDERSLRVLPPTLEPKATAFIEPMIDMITILINKGFAYTTSSGNVFYAVQHFSGYGKLSGKALSDLKAGERVSIHPEKRDALDFVLWKAAKPNEPSWESPWGAGRPGWHIECSAMSAYHLGQQFDIHGGGQDLLFPHHENEIAQSEAAHDQHGHSQQMVNYWMHNGFVRIVNNSNGATEKMSKSLGNFFTIRTLLEKYDAEVLRLFILRAHYRSPLNYSSTHLDDTKLALDRLYLSLRGHPPQQASVDKQDPATQRFIAAMNDDFNTPEAIAVLFDLVSVINKTGSVTAIRLLRGLANILGLLERDAESYLQGKNNDCIHIETLIEKRRFAKQQRDFETADSIRLTLLSQGITLEDSAQGTVWRRT